MYEVTAHAVRHNGTIEVTISGFLPDSCHKAQITDVYPGGNIMYVRDPGYAQVFVSETSKPSANACATVLVPWAETVHIFDSMHKEVEVLINRKKMLTIPVVEKGAKFIVIRLLGDSPKGSCSIIPEGTPYILIYEQVYGPAAYEKCFDWVADNCSSKDLQPFSLAGGGSEAPRGFL